MAVYRPTKASKIWWYDFIFEGQRVRESAKTRSKTVAKEAEKVRRRQLEESYNGIKRRHRAKLFSIAAEEWLALKALTLAPSSLRIERDNLKHLRPHFEKRLVSDIQAKDVSQYQQTRLVEKASPKTINLEVGTLRAILRRNRVWSEIQPDIRMLPILDEVGRALSKIEEAALIAACLMSRSRSLYPAVMLALNTGMRYSEIRLLQWKHVDFSAKTLIVGKSKTPTGSGRAIPLNNKIRSVLEMWAAQFSDRDLSHYVFPFERYGGKGELNTFGFGTGVSIYNSDPTRPVGDWKEAWEKAKMRAAAILQGGSVESPTGKPPRKSDANELISHSPKPFQCRFHDLRHTAVTRLLEAGIPYPIVANLMGWSAATAIRMAKRYGHIGTQALRKATDVLGIEEVSMASLKKPPIPGNSNLPSLQ